MKRLISQLFFIGISILFTAPILRAEWIETTRQQQLNQLLSMPVDSLTQQQRFQVKYYNIYKLDISSSYSINIFENTNPGAAIKHWEYRIDGKLGYPEVRFQVEPNTQEKELLQSWALEKGQALFQDQDQGQDWMGFSPSRIDYVLEFLEYVNSLSPISPPETLQAMKKDISRKNNRMTKIENESQRISQHRKLEAQGYGFCNNLGTVSTLEINSIRHWKNYHSN